MIILKYIITDKEIPVIFSSEIQHNNVLETGVSAGFLIISYDAVYFKFSAKCFGESSSLDLKSEDKDELVIENYLNSSFVSQFDSINDN